MRTLLTLAAAATLAAPAAADWRNYDGQKCPPISAKEWINTGREAPSNDLLRGKVFLLEFFATW